jgi:hypothetical protein
MTKTTITVEKSTKDELDDVGRHGDTFDDIILKLIRVYRNVEQSPRSKKLIEVSA